MRLLAAAVLLAGCASGSSGPAAPRSPDMTASSPPPASPAAVEAEVLAAYRAYVGAVSTAWQHPRDWRARLVRTATNGQLEQITSRLQELADADRSLRGTVRLSPTVTSLNGDRAVIHDCQDSSQFLIYDNRTGRPFGTGVPRKDPKIVDLVRVGGVWKVEHIRPGSFTC